MSFALPELVYEADSEFIIWLSDDSKEFIDLNRRKRIAQLLSIQSFAGDKGATLILIDTLPEHFNSKAYYESTGLDFQRHIRNTAGLEQDCDVMVYITEEDFKKDVSGNSVLVGKNRYGTHVR